MTVADLIAHLKDLPQNHRVVVEAYQSGYNDLAAPSIIVIRPQIEREADASCGVYCESFDGEEAILVSAALQS